MFNIIMPTTLEKYIEKRNFILVCKISAYFKNMTNSNWFELRLGGQSGRMVPS